MDLIVPRSRSAQAESRQSISDRTIVQVDPKSAAQKTRTKWQQIAIEAPSNAVRTGCHVCTRRENLANSFPALEVSFDLRLNRIASSLMRRHLKKILTNYSSDHGDPPPGSVMIALLAGRRFYACRTALARRSWMPTDHAWSIILR